MASSLKHPVDDIFFSKASSVVLLDSLMEELLLRQVINLELLSEGMVLNGVYLSQHDRHSSCLQDFSSLSELRVTLMLIEVGQYVLMLLHHLFEVVLMQVDDLLILKDGLLSKLRVFRVFEIYMACNGMFRVLWVKWICVFLL